MVHHNVSSKFLFVSNEVDVSNVHLCRIISNNNHSICVFRSRSVTLKHCFTTSETCSYQQRNIFSISTTSSPWHPWQKSLCRRVYAQCVLICPNCACAENPFSLPHHLLDYLTVRRQWSPRINGYQLASLWTLQCSTQHQCVGQQALRKSSIISRQLITTIISQWLLA